MEVSKAQHIEKDAEVPKITTQEMITPSFFTTAPLSLYTGTERSDGLLASTSNDLITQHVSYIIMCSERGTFLL